MPLTRTKPRVLLVSGSKPGFQSLFLIVGNNCCYCSSHLIFSTDKEAEAAVLAVLRASFPSHLILGEEGGVSGDPDSDYLWCVDPLGECMALDTLQHFRCVASSDASGPRLTQMAPPTSPTGTRVSPPVWLCSIEGSLPLRVWYVSLAPALTLLVATTSAMLSPLVVRWSSREGGPSGSEDSTRPRQVGVGMGLPFLPLASV